MIPIEYPPSITGFWKTKKPTSVGIMVLQKPTKPIMLCKATYNNTEEKLHMLYILLCEAKTRMRRDRCFFFPLFLLLKMCLFSYSCHLANLFLFIWLALSWRDLGTLFEGRIGYGKYLVNNLGFSYGDHQSFKFFCFVMCIFEWPLTISY